MAPFAAGQQPVKGPLMTHKRDRGGAGGQTAEVCVCARVHVRVRDGEGERGGGATAVSILGCLSNRVCVWGCARS